jgi:thiol-disulfide isomerase/thioredoxin
VDTPSPEEMKRLLAENDLVVVDYYATWCVPCKTYSPKFQRLEREMRRAFPDAKVAFVSVDVDRDHAEAKRGRVQSVPTTVAWRLRKGLFGPKRKEALRFNGDRTWNDLVRTFTELMGSL